MTILELTDNLETFGADLSRWPTHLVDEALDLLEQSDEAKDLFARATADDLSIFGDAAAADEPKKAV